MSKYLDRLIEDYNQRAKITSRYAPLTNGRVYSEEKKEENKKEDALFDKNLKKLDELLNKLSDNVQNIGENIVESATKEEELVKKIENAYRAALKVRHMSRNKIVSPRTYRKIISYYRRHKRQGYYSKYKLDNELHNFIMRLGRYLESLDKDASRWEVRDFSFDYHYYALSIPVLLSGGLKEVLGYLSTAVKEIAHAVEIILHIVVEVFPNILHYIPGLSSIMPHFLAACLVAFLAGSILIIIGYSLHPERKVLFKRLTDKLKINLGIRKSHIHSAYIIYVYKLYDLLSTVASYVIEVGKLISKGKNIDDEKVHKELIEKAKNSTHFVGIIDKLLHFIGEKSKMELFEKIKDKIETLKKTITVDLESVKELVDSIREGNNEINILNCKFAVSAEAMERLVNYYGDNFKGDGEWIEVNVQYRGGAYHKSANPLSNVNIPGFNGKPEEIANFIGAVLAISDKLVVDRIGKQKFENPLVIVDLQKLKILSYKSEPFIDKLLKPVKTIADWLTNKKKEKLDPDTIGIKMFEAYISLNVIKSMGTEEEGEGKETQAEVEEE